MSAAEIAPRKQVHNIGRRRAWAIWSVGVGVYVLAVFHRSSLGVAGLLAAERFDVSATELALFAVLQLVVYAGLQVPVGVLLDRYGPRRLLISGLTVMTVGQLGFAFSTTLSGAVAARAVLGAGDALIFVSVLRLVSAWFLVRQAPMVTQLTGQLGQLGTIIAAAPLSWALHRLGWTAAFGLASSIGVVLMVAVVLLVKDSPYRLGDPVKIKMRALARTLSLVWGNPGTKLGMWTHFTSQYAVTVFTLLWGFPFLVRGQGLSPELAGTLLMTMTGWVVVSGIALGRLVPRFPYYRSWIVVGIVLVMAGLWTVVLLWPGPAPLPLLMLMLMATGTGGPASMVSFDLARTFTPAQRLGRANGFVNIGGFTASLLAMGVIGLLLDLHHAGSGATYDRSDFRFAMAAQFVLWGLGLVQILRYRFKALAHLERVHPGAVDMLKRGETFVHPGIGEREGV